MRALPFAASACLAFVAFAAAPRAGLLAPSAARPQRSLEAAMDELKSNLKALATSVADPARETQALEALSAMQAVALAAKVHDPENLAQVPEAERESHRRAFRAEMLELVRELARLEILLLEGRRDEVVAAIRGPLMERRNAAHKRFQKED